MATGRAAKGARRLGGVLSRVRRRAPLVRGVRTRSPSGVSAVRRSDLAPMSPVQCTVPLGLRGRLRVVRGATAWSGALRDEDPPLNAARWNDLREADHGDRVI